MGTFKVEIDIGDPHGEHFESADALVDTGASYTLVPASTLRRMGVEPMDTWPFELADGTFRDYEVDETRVRIDGRTATTVVVFGDQNMGVLLGRMLWRDCGLGSIRWAGG